ncbi:MAG: trigger factor [Oscillatoria sp. SIO1A7]|nr:trigger factor [Oscillatoria sp. SIO1A7]
MKVTQEKLPQSQIGIEIEIPPETSSKAYNKVIQEFSRSNRIPGFRPGKVPRQVLLQRLGVSRVKATVLEEIIQDSLKKAIEQEDIEALGNFQLRSDFDELVSQFEPGKALTFSATVDVHPEIKVSQYNGLQVRAEEVKYDPADTEKFLEERRQEQGTLIPVEGRPAVLGDLVVVDYSGRFPGEDGESQPIPGGGASDFQMELQEDRFVEGFVGAIVGMNPGETKEVTVNFPSDYGNEELANKEAIFTITLKDLKEKELPELDDDFAQATSEFQTIAELREHLENQYKEKAERETKANKQEALLEELYKWVEADLPETMVIREAEELVQQAANRLSNLGIDVSQLYSRESQDRLREQYRSEAVKKLTISLGLSKIGEQESIQVEQVEIDSRVEEVRASLTGEVDPERLRSFLSEEMIKEKTLEWIEERANIELLPQGTLAAEKEAAEKEAAEKEAVENANLLQEPASAPGLGDAGTETIDVSAQTLQPESEPGSEPESEQTPADSES